LIREQTGEGRRFASVALDYRAVAGPLEIESVFNDAIRSASKDASFVRGLAVIAVAYKPPTGFLRDLVVEHGGSHAGTLTSRAEGSSRSRRSREAAPSHSESC
jgi:CBS domain-containing protein